MTVMAWWENSNSYKLKYKLPLSNKPRGFIVISYFLFLGGFGLCDQFTALYVLAKFFDEAQLQEKLQFGDDYKIVVLKK